MHTIERINLKARADLTDFLKSPFYLLLVFLIMKRSHILHQSYWISIHLLHNLILNVRSLLGKHEGDERVGEGERGSQS